MGDVYNESMVMKKLAENVASFFNQASTKLPYTKGLKGIIKSKENDSYIVTINGLDYKLKTDYDLKTGNFVNLISMQNQGNDLVFIPSANNISQVQINMRVDDDTETLYFV